jgi:glycosyltransferase involved in cell wall biosynthesis
LGVADLPATEPRATILTRHGIPSDAIVLAAFGGITPEKRIAPLLNAVANLSAALPQLHLMLVGDEVAHFDVRHEAARRAVSRRVHLTGYVPDDSVASYLTAADICACLRWPTNRETSASWLRCLAAGRATIVTDLAHLQDVPFVRFPATAPSPDAGAGAIGVSVDVLDEERALPAAVNWLASSGSVRARLARAARDWWRSHHTLDQMADDYERAFTRATSRPPGRPPLPGHLRDDGSGVLRALADTIGIGPQVADFLR